MKNVDLFHAFLYAVQTHNSGPQRAPSLKESNEFSCTVLFLVYTRILLYFTSCLPNTTSALRKTQIEIRRFSRNDDHINIDGWHKIQISLQQERMFFPSAPQPVCRHMVSGVSRIFIRNRTFARYSLKTGNISTFVTKIRNTQKFAGSLSTVLFSMCYVLFSYDCLLTEQGFIWGYIFMAICTLLALLRCELRAVITRLASANRVATLYGYYVTSTHAVWWLLLKNTCSYRVKKTRYNWQYLIKYWEMHFVSERSVV